ncbi:hypothetical protein [Candidatus Contubernalis alkaliaceticus]|uniref:hypothetical protein n=1 Tax=Candidatus Contubernalis alkaliaceticus TaxID=338645 RepID=UPI001F4BFBCF|nr:hypothetical protein [Candidatus Contubernalis alkalaceticus]UNC91648.1 hypothetical protein HUE98_05810 [Candidatus Contubernalis alkalaceticus]
MFKKTFLWLALLLCLSLMFMGCSSTEIDSVRDNGVMGDQPAAKVSESSNDEQQEVQQEASEDEWEVYELSIEEEWKDLKVEILALSIGEQKETRYLDEPADAIALKFRIENTRADGDGSFKVYPTQGTLVTSTGEQVKPMTGESDSISGEIYEGVIKDGVIIWFLERGHVFDIEWVRVKFNCYDEAAERTSVNEFDIRIEIPE